MRSFARVFARPSNNTCTDCRTARLCACPPGRQIEIDFKDDKAISFARLE